MNIKTIAKPRRIAQFSALAAALLALGACVYEPVPVAAGPGPGYAYAPGYYAPPVVGSVDVGVGYRGGWRGGERWR